MNLTDKQKHIISETISAIGAVSMFGGGFAWFIWQWLTTPY